MTDDGFDGLYLAVGRRVKQYRNAKRMSQAELADAIGMLRTSVTNIESGRQRPPLCSLYLIAKALGVRVSVLLPDELNPPPVGY